MHPIVEDFPVREVLVYAIGGPLVLLPVLYAVSGLVSVAFGDVVFGLTLVTSFGWILLNLNDTSRASGAGARSILSRRSERFRDVEPASPAQLRSMAKVLFALTGTVVLGWGILLASMGG